MKLIGLAGPARSGKDTIADHLVKNHGFTKFSFSDALYEEVSKAFRVSVEFLMDAKIKDTPRTEMCLRDCFDHDFIDVAVGVLERGDSDLASTMPLSPRWVLQTWGTEYRRAQDPEYWIKRADEWLDRHLSYDPAYRFVNTSVRYPNEAEWLRMVGGKVWHVSRGNAPKVRSHSSEVPVPFVRGDQRIMNNSSINHLWTMTTLLLNSPYESVWVEPEETEGV